MTNAMMTITITAAIPATAPMKQGDIREFDD